MKQCVIALLCGVLAGCSSVKPSEADDDMNSGAKAKATTPAASEVIAKNSEPALPSKENPLPELNTDSVVKKKILVLPFQNRSLIGGKDVGEQAAYEIQDRLYKMPEFLVVSEADMNGSEPLANEYGEYRMKTLFDRCRANGISAFIIGSVEDLLIQEHGDEVGVLRTRQHTVNASVKFQMYDVSSERLLLSRLTQAESTDETTKLFGSRTPDSYDSRRSRAAIKKALETPLAMLPDYAKRIAWVGRIAKVDLHRYYINAGEATGLSRGQLLRVYSEGAPVVDQETGEMLGMAPGRFKGTLKVVDFFGNDGAVAVLHSGAGFREKDRVDVFRAN